MMLKSKFPIYEKDIVKFIHMSPSQQKEAVGEERIETWLRAGIEYLKSRNTHLENEVARLKKFGLVRKIGEVPQISGKYRSNDVLPAIDDLFRAIGAYFGANRFWETSARNHEYVQARMVASAILKHAYGYSAPKIASMIGLRNHTSILHYLKRAVTNRDDVIKAAMDIGMPSMAIKNLASGLTCKAECIT